MTTTTKIRKQNIYSGIWDVCQIFGSKPYLPSMRKRWNKHQPPYIQKAYPQLPIWHMYLWIGWVLTPLKILKLPHKPSILLLCNINYPGIDRTNHLCLDWYNWSEPPPYFLHLHNVRQNNLHWLANKIQLQWILQDTKTGKTKIGNSKIAHCNSTKIPLQVIPTMVTGEWQ